MLPAVQAILRQPRPERAIDAATRLGLRTNLRLCLDAGDHQSYGAATQVWLDRTEGGYDFNLGATSGAEASDPTFVGTYGNLRPTAYWLVDGADWFTYDSANESWMTNIHKDNAAFTLLCWVNISTLGFNAHLSGTVISNTNTNIGYYWRKSAANVHDFIVHGNTGGAAVMAATGTLPLLASVWYMLAVSVDEAKGTGFFWTNGQVETFTSTYTAPSAAGATAVMQVSASGNGQNPLPTNSLMPMFLAWEGRALSPAEIGTFYQATRGRIERISG